MARVNFIFGAGALGLALLAVGLQGIVYALLVPTIHTLIGGSADSFRETFYFQYLAGLIPSQMRTPGSRPLISLIGFVFLMMLLKNLIQMVYNMSVMVQVKQFSTRLRFLIYERYLGFGKFFFDKNHAGHLQNIVINHPRHVAQSLRALHQVFYAAALLAISLMIMAKISWLLTIITLIVWPFLTLLVGRVIRQIRKASILLAKDHARLARKISNTLSCIPLIKAFSSETREKESFKKFSDAVEEASAKIEKKQAVIGPVQEMAGLTMIFILMMLLPFVLSGKGSGTVAGHLVFFLVLRRSTASFGAFARLRAVFASLRGALDELEEIFSDRDKYAVMDGAHEFRGVEREICFERLSFNYPRQKKPALKNVSFKMEKGRMTAIVGLSGSGKTTLIHLLMRLYECPRGTLFADGRDICDFTLQSYHRRLAYIGQESLLFNETILFNLTYGLEETEFSQESLTRVLKQARLNDFVMTLPDGLNTPVGDRGIRLSGGERQRLSIARALLKQAEILVLDEATSALDSETERLIQEAVQDAVKDRTSIVIAHRLSTIRHADRIVVLEEGMIAEQGTLEELLARKGRFLKLWEAQKFY